MTRHSTVAFAAVLAAVATASAVAQTPEPLNVSPELLRTADSIAGTEFAKDSLGSITVGIVMGPQLVWAKSYGYMDSARTRAASPSTVYRIASVTKQFTAVMLLQLLERGRLRLSDPVSRYVPEIQRISKTSPRSASVSMVQLATMTSGLAREANDGRKSQFGPTSRWKETLLASIPLMQFARPPGSGYGYSNVGYGILGVALSRAAGEPFIAYQKRHIIQPLGLSHTSFDLTDDMRSNLAVGVDWDNGKLVYSDAAGEHVTGMGYRVPSGGLYSTVEDLAKFISLELGFGPEAVLKRATLEARDNIPVASYPSLDYGYGVGLQAMRWGDTVAVGHSGNLAGYTSMVLYDRAAKFGVIVLRSAGGGEADAGRLGGRLFRLVYRMRQK